VTPPSTVYVLMIGDRPTAAATTLQAAQAQGIAAETRHGDPHRRELRWDAPRSDEWRLMGRRRDENGVARGRWSWTQRAIHAVPSADGNAS